ncbi:MAG: hypothetical protein J7605_02655 [Variovorax sp.]|nr:hypothetical protein [Variovorax sp.]
MISAVLTRWLLAVLVSVALGSSWLLDGPTETDAAQATADSVADAISQARHVAITGVDQ